MTERMDKAYFKKNVEDMTDREVRRNFKEMDRLLQSGNFLGGDFVLWQRLLFAMCRRGLYVPPEGSGGSKRKKGSAGSRPDGRPENSVCDRIARMRTTVSGGLIDLATFIRANAERISVSLERGSAPRRQVDAIMEAADKVTALGKEILADLETIPGIVEDWQAGGQAGDRNKKVSREFHIKFSLAMARPASRFVRTCQRFASSVVVSCEDVRVDGKSILGLMSIGAVPGKRIAVAIEGPDAVLAMEVLTEVIATLDVECAL